MCTVSVIRTSSEGLRVLVNRDEQRSRLPSTDASAIERAGRHLVMPIDAESGGTWVGLSDVGLVGCLLNLNPSRPRPGNVGRFSRGLIVPRVLEAEDLASAWGFARAIDAGAFAPFRLLVLDERQCFVCIGDGVRITACCPSSIASPMMLTSSGLGDDLVQAPRRRALDRALAEAGSLQDAQDALHSSREAPTSGLAVLMSRDDARTVSRTEILLGAEHALFRHTRLGDTLEPDGPASQIELTLRTQSARA